MNNFNWEILLCLLFATWFSSFVTGVERSTCENDSTGDSCRADTKNVNEKHSYFPEWTANSEHHKKSLLQKYLTTDVFELLKDRKTKHGVTLHNVIASGVANQDSNIGVYLGDQESMDTFAELLHPIIADYHGIENIDTLRQPRNDDKIFAPGNQLNSSFILSTRIRVARNLRGFALTPTISKEERFKIERKVVDILTKQTKEPELSGHYASLATMTEETRLQLVADHFLFKKGDRFLEAAGINRDWPEGRGIFHNAAKTFLVWLNEEDHLRIISMQQGGDILAVYDRLRRAVDLLEEALGGFQFHEKFGYIASCPSNLGTGMRASVHLKIPIITSEQPELFRDILDTFNLDARGIHGEHSEASGDGVFDISNKRRLGLKDADCLDSLYEGVQRLIELEIDSMK